MYIHIVVQFPELFHLVKQTMYPISNNSPSSSSPSPWQPLFYFLSIWILLVWVPHTSRIIQYLSFCDCLISLSIMSSRFLRVIPCVWIFFLFKAENIPFYVYTTFCLSIHLLMDSLVASTFWLTWMMLLWTWVCKYIFKALLRFFWIYT